MINFLFTWTSEHQSMGNVHSSTKLLAIKPVASHFNPHLSAMCKKIDIHDRYYDKIFMTTHEANGILFHYFLLPSQQIYPLDYNSCFAWSLSPVAGFPNILIDLISLNSIIETKFLHVWTESNHNEVHLQLLLSYLLVNNLTLMLSYIFWHKIWVFRIPNLHFWRYF